MAGGPASLSSSSTKDSITEGLVMTGEDGLMMMSIPAPLQTPQLTHIGLPCLENKIPSNHASNASFSTNAVVAAATASSSTTDQTDQAIINHVNGHSRNASQQSWTGSVGYGSLVSAQSRQGSIEVENRVDSTRVNPDDIIQELVASNLAQTALTGEDQEQDEVGLEIFVGKDGTATLGSRSGTNERKNKRKPQSSSSSNPHQNHSNRNSSHNPEASVN
jgi:hypothetical protein